MKKPRILITGGTGLLALNWAYLIRDKWEIFLAINSRVPSISGASVLWLDLKNIQGLLSEVKKISPNLIIHTAALTNVEKCEIEKNIAYESNAMIAKNIAIVSEKINVPLVHISTDHIFSGDRAFYTENDEPNPTNEYARSKLLGEKFVITENSKALIVRTNFFGWGHAHRSSFSDWIIQNLRSNNEIKLYDNVFFTPILVDCLVSAVHELVEKNASGIFNVVGEERLSKFEFAIKTAQMFNLPAGLIVRAKMNITDPSIKRPLDMSLDNGKIRANLGRSLGNVDYFMKILKAAEEGGRSSQLFNSVTTRMGN